MQKTILLLSAFFLNLTVMAQPCMVSAPSNNGPVIVQFQQPRQSFTAGCSGAINSISFNLFTSALAPPTTPLSVELRSIGSGVCSPGALIATSNPTPIATGINTYTFATPPVVNIGTQYVLSIIGGSPSFISHFGAAPSNNYLGGTSSYNHNTLGCTVNNFSWEFNVNITANPLSISLASFNAQPIANNIVQLNWETTDELNNKLFVVEKSQDGKHWVTSNTVPADQLTSYRTEDNEPYDGTSYYRLKQINVDETYFISDAKKIILSLQNNITISPNPTSDKILISGDTYGKEIVMFTPSGKKVTSITRIKRKQEVGIDLDLSALTEGIYILRIGNKTHKIIKN